MTDSDNDDDGHGWDESQGESDEWEKNFRPDYQDDFKDRERAGEDIIGCWSKGLDGEKLKTQTPRGHFCSNVDAIARNIKSVCNKITTEDIQILLDISGNEDKMPKVAFKNPTGFVLGYIASGGGLYPLTRDRLNMAKTCYDDKIKSFDDTIKDADIIRYARFWKTLVKQDSPAARRERQEREEADRRRARRQRTAAWNAAHPAETWQEQQEREQDEEQAAHEGW